MERILTTGGETMVINRNPMERAYRDYARTLPGLDEHTRALVERAFKSGMLVMMVEVGRCRIAAELLQLKIDVRDEAKDFVDSIPCTCGECEKRSRGTSGSHPQGG
jgi:hypothetical protein